MTEKQRRAYEWAKNQDYPSVAAQYAKILCELVDDLQSDHCARQEQAPCSHCGCGGKHLDAPPCTTCPANQKEQQSSTPLTPDELRSRVGKWVWVVVDYAHCKCDGWAFIPTPAFVAYLDQTISIDSYGKRFVAYDYKPEK